MTKFNRLHAALTKECQEHGLPSPLVVEPEDCDQVCYISGSRFVTMIFDKYFIADQHKLQSGIWPAEHAQQLQDHFYGVGDE